MDLTYRKVDCLMWKKFDKFQLKCASQHNNTAGFN